VSLFKKKEKVKADGHFGPHTVVHVAMPKHIDEDRYSWKNTPLSHGYVQMPPIPERYHTLIVQALNAAYVRTGDPEILEFNHGPSLLKTRLVTEEYAKNWESWFMSHKDEWSRLK